MQLEEMFKRLSHGELSHLSLGMQGAGTIAADKQALVVSQINSALTALYSRFVHRRAYLIMETSEDIQEYTLSPLHAVSNVDPLNLSPRYILDTPAAPYTGDLIKILSVRRRDDPSTTEDEGRLFGINLRGSPHGVQVISHDKMRFADPQPGETFEVEYQANHAKLTNPPVLTEMISVMPALEEALQVRVAAGILMAMGGELHLATGKGHMQHYEQLCMMAQNDDMTQEGGSDVFDRLRDKGFI